ncbi:MAG: hypothetical protein Q8O53_03600, partial [Candidatus Moranbacteria bacterium]|nr:hypothetical protein [Candidatus Moranbacteria bacterium]
MKKILIGLMLILGWLGAAQAESWSYQMKSGETLFGRFGPKTGSEICQLNKKLGTLAHCDRVGAGQWLVVPEKVGGQALVQMTVTSVVRPMAKDEACVNLGVAPFNPEHRLSVTLQGVDLLPLTEAQKQEAKELIALGSPAEKTVWLTDDLATRYDMLFRSKVTGKPVLLRNRQLCSPANGARAELGDIYRLSDGTEIALPRVCGNISVIRRTPKVAPPPIVVTPQPVTPVVVTVPPPAAETPPAVKVPDAPPAPLSAFPKVNEVAEWEVIVGAGVWDNNLAHGKWHYGEGMLSAVLPDGYRVGIGAFGMWGSGSSETSAYQWREKGVGPQIGIKRNFLKEQVDQFGQTTLLPAGWGLKARFLND